MYPFISVLISDYGLIGMTLAVCAVSYMKLAKDFTGIKLELREMEEETIKTKVITSEVRSDIKEIKHALEKLNDHLLRR